MRIKQATEVERLEDHLHTPSDEVDVNQGEWQHASGKLSTVTVASCAVLAAHNDSTKRGLLGHFSCISPEAQLNPWLSKEHFDTAAFNSAVNYIPSLGPSHATSIWLGGVALYELDSVSIRNSKLADRRYAEARIGELAAWLNIPNEAISVGWNTSENDLYVRLECEAGALLVQPIIE